MCFYTKFTKIRIATEDIVCYKRVKIDGNCCLSLYQDFKYEYNKTYSGKSKWILFLKWLLNFYIESEGYHSYIDDWVRCHSKANVKCIIPKGSLYIINKFFGEYCSSSIIIKNPNYDK